MYLVRSLDQLMKLSLQSCLVMYAIISTHINRLVLNSESSEIRLTMETRVFSKLRIYLICNKEMCPEFAKRHPIVV